MDLKKIKALVDLVVSSGISELSMKEDDFELKITGSFQEINKKNIETVINYNNKQQVPFANVSSETNNDFQINNIQKPNSEDSKIIYSPMVGTFYRSSAPDKPPFTELNQHINVGGILCIIEAMKLMNQIESEFNGTIVNIFVDNATPVEYGQPLFEIKLDV